MLAQTTMRAATFSYLTATGLTATGQSNAPHRPLALFPRFLHPLQPSSSSPTSPPTIPQSHVLFWSPVPLYNRRPLASSRTSCALAWSVFLCLPVETSGPVQLPHFRSPGPRSTVRAREEQKSLIPLGRPPPFAGLRRRCLARGRLPSACLSDTLAHLPGPCNVHTPGPARWTSEP